MHVPRSALPRGTPQVDPEGEFADYYGKSLSGDEMYEKMSKLIIDWEKQRWWDSVLPAWLATPQLAEGAKRAEQAAKERRQRGA